MSVRDHTSITKGTEFGGVHKPRLQDEVGPKISTFCQRLYHRNYQRRGVGGQEQPTLCQRSL